MRKQEYKTPQIYVKVTNLAPVMETVSITGEPTGQGNHTIVGAKSSSDFDDFDDENE